jgi:hypothetical protein
MSYKLIAVIMCGLTWAGIVRAEDQPIEQQLVDAMNQVFGVSRGTRSESSILFNATGKRSPPCNQSRTRSQSGNRAI